MEVVPLDPGEYAKPIRGRKLVFWAFGAPKVMSPGTFEIEFSGCHSTL